MQSKRSGEQDEGRELTPAVDPAVALQAMRQSAHPAKAEDDKMSLFWRLFGGTVMSIAALVAVTLYNNINNNITALQTDLARANEARANLQGEMRTEFGKVAEARGELIRKDEFNTRISNAHERIQALQAQNNTQNAAMTGLKSELDAIKERAVKNGVDDEAARKDFVATIEALKKEQTTSTDAIKKDMAALDVLREKVITLSAEMKAERDDFTKLRQEVDKNQAYDIERRDARTAQMKELDVVIKEMQKSAQECRERVARLEAVMSAPAPQPAAQPQPMTVTPAGGFPPLKKPAARVSTPVEGIEEAPPPRKVRD